MCVTNANVYQRYTFWLVPILRLFCRRCRIVLTRRYHCCAQHFRHLLFFTHRSIRLIVHIPRTNPHLQQRDAQWGCDISIFFMRNLSGFFLCLQQPIYSKRRHGDRVPISLRPIRPNMRIANSYVHQRHPLWHVHQRFLHRRCRTILHLCQSIHPERPIGHCVPILICTVWTNMRVTNSYL